MFNAYVSCDLPKQVIQGAKASTIKVTQQGKLTQLVCSYPEGVNFSHRTRAQCQLDAGVDCAANPASCKASCN